MAVAILLLYISLGAVSAKPLTRTEPKHSAQHGDVGSGEDRAKRKADEQLTKHVQFNEHSKTSSNSQKGRRGQIIKRIISQPSPPPPSSPLKALVPWWTPPGVHQPVHVCTLDPSQMKGVNDSPMPTPVQMAEGPDVCMRDPPTPRMPVPACPCGGCKCKWLDACFKAHVDAANSVAKTACSKALGNAAERAAASDDDNKCCRNAVRPCLRWQPECYAILQASTNPSSKIRFDADGATRAVLLQRMMLQTATSGGDGSNDFAHINMSVASARESNTRSNTSLDDTLADKCAAR